MLIKNLKMISIYSNKYLTITDYIIVIIFIVLFPFSLNNYCHAQEKTHLAEGIKLYRSGNIDDALNELRAEIDINPKCPLAYYYGAKIRIEKEQYSRAKQNIEAALRDSSDFHDAYGLLAFILMNMGQQTEALAVWKGFVETISSIEKTSPLTATSIITPEEYHKQQQIEKERKERDRLEAEKKELERREIEESELKKIQNEKNIDSEEKDDLEMSDEGNKTKSSTNGPLLSENEIEDVIEEIETPMEELEKRIRSSIRTGIYGITFSIIMFAIGIFVTFYLIRKHREKKEELIFSHEVERLLIENEVDIDEEMAIKEFEDRKHQLSLEEQKPVELSTSVANHVIDNSTENTEQSPLEIYNLDNKIKSPITEEIKTFVSRLYREGHSTDEIARTADLTKSEVNLILAVREHHTQNLIEKINREEKELLDRNQLIHAIHAEGLNTRDIAKKLNISTSEVNLASTIINIRKKNLKVE